MSDRTDRVEGRESLPDAAPRGPRAGAAGAPLPRVPRSCPACGSEQAAAREDRLTDREPCAVRCARCGLVFVDPVPPEATRTDTYGPDYYEPWQAREETPRTGLWKRRLALVEKRSTRGALLDVGCGDGLFLRIAREAGWDVEGVEFSPEGARRASHRLGRPVAVGDLARGHFLKGPFDVLTLWHVLEHLPDPAAMLEAARARLRRGGLLVVAVPNLDNLPMRLAYRVGRGRPLPLYEIGAREPHLSHFSATVLKAFLERRGFERIDIRPDRCALTWVKRTIDAGAAILSALTGRLMTDAMVAFARRPA